jgi:GNAT superfamily N-acetyltransferase
VLPSNALFIRPARREDCFEIARLFLMASEGLAEYIWSRIAEPGESLIEAGARRCSGEATGCSYQNCFITELANTTVGMLNSFPMEERDGPDDLNADPALRPLVELRDYGSLFVSGVAVYPEHRNRGIGTRLLATTEQQAVSYGLTRLSQSWRIQIAAHLCAIRRSLTHAPQYFSDQQFPDRAVTPAPHRCRVLRYSP